MEALFSCAANFTAWMQVRIHIKNGQNLLFADEVLLLAYLSCRGKQAGSDCFFPVYQTPAPSRTRQTNGTTMNLQELQALPRWLRLLSPVALLLWVLPSWVTALNPSRTKVEWMKPTLLLSIPQLHKMTQKNYTSWWISLLCNATSLLSTKPETSQGRVSFINHQADFFFFFPFLFPSLSCKFSCQLSSWCEFLQQGNITSENRHVHWKAWHTLYGACEWQNHNQKPIKTLGNASSIQLQFWADQP